MAKLDLRDIQGLVISGYGHLRHGLYLFVTFGSAASGRTWLDRMAGRVSDGSAWPTRGGKTVKPDHALNLALTFAGLQALGLPQDSLDSFPMEFQQGMAHPDRSRILGDIEGSAPEKWQFGGADADNLHAIIILLTDTPERRSTMAGEIKRGLAAQGISTLYEQEANGLPDSREHFGFFDGISQPFLDGGPRKPSVDEPPIRPGEFVLGYENEYAQIPFSPQLKGDDLGRNGSYVVVRKLYQDVATFWRFMADNRPEADEFAALKETSDGERQVWLASKFVGRWPSGCPLVMAPYKDNPDIPFEQLNRFYFHTRDPHGDACPFGSHIRRTNPRDSLPPSREDSLTFANRHLIIRRGMAYGEPLFPLDTLPPQKPPGDDGAERGLMFLCVNANIARQFEFVQQTWVENTKFHGLYNDKDPLIGGCDEKTDHTIQADPVRRKVKGLPRFVQMRGGGYFFLPSISALKRIAAL